VPEHSASASKQERAARKTRNIGYSIWKSAYASALLLQMIVSVVIFLFLAVLKMLVNWLENASYKLEGKHEIKGTQMGAIPQKITFPKSPNQHIHQQ
jgi:hypothetical protein